MDSEVAKANQQKHFILVHGGCHGAWCWYKLKRLLESEGQRVTVIDLAASGVNMKRPEEIHTLDDYAEPLMKLMAAIPADEKVILVGHSFGGCSLALAMENYPEKISVAVFIAAIMPDLNHSLEYFMDQLTSEKKKLRERSQTAYIDTQFIAYGNPEKPEVMVLLGPKDLSAFHYQLSPVEDLELAKLLARPTPLLKEDFSNRKFSAAYGSVKRVYIICSEDMAVPTDFQRWQVENFEGEEVRVIVGADHMPMFSKPEELCRSLLDVVQKYC